MQLTPASRDEIASVCAEPQKQSAPQPAVRDNGIAPVVPAEVTDLAPLVHCESWKRMSAGVMCSGKNARKSTGGLDREVDATSQTS